MTIARFFYTTETPHSDNRGPHMQVLNERGQYISSIEEAAVLAMNYRYGAWGTSGFIRTTYGVMYETPELADDVT